MVSQALVECSLHGGSLISLVSMQAGHMRCNLHLGKRRKQFKPQIAVLDKHTPGCSVVLLKPIEECSPRDGRVE